MFQNVVIIDMGSSAIRAGVLGEHGTELFNKNYLCLYHS